MVSFNLVAMAHHIALPKWGLWSAIATKINHLTNFILLFFGAQMEISNPKEEDHYNEGPWEQLTPP